MWEYRTSMLYMPKCLEHEACYLPLEVGWSPWVSSSVNQHSGLAGWKLAGAQLGRQLHPSSVPITQSTTCLSPMSLH
ncbi:hypothetical protein E2C01_010873 [Portunus trituberculatus]|uniref:Uncharacterized protein n=1 Tax=Portunus trituberculatus TaxID=210409 RepID=A0A5B7D9R8_PORTR|nr:hypothetical protein [Portunus trituberculatus]